MMRCMTAICPAGPPNESRATRSQTRNASASETPWDGLVSAEAVSATAVVCAIGCSSAALFAERLVKVVEHGATPREPLRVVAIGRADPGDQAANAGRLLASELFVFEINVVHDLADGGQRGIVQSCTTQQNLEGAAVALVGELSLEHVEAQLIGFGHVAFGWHELEAGLRVDEALDQPRRGDPVDMHPLTGHPRAPVNTGEGHRPPFLRIRCFRFFAQPVLQAR